MSTATTYYAVALTSRRHLCAYYKAVHGVDHAIRMMVECPRLPQAKPGEVFLQGDNPREVRLYHRRQDAQAAARQVFIHCVRVHGGKDTPIAHVVPTWTAPAT